MGGSDCLNDTLGDRIECITEQYSVISYQLSVVTELTNTVNY
ncbi:hypothetical protein [Nostoc sp.]